MTEHIMEKTTTERLIERPFTTQPQHYVKRGCNTVRSRAILFIEQLKNEGYSLELPLEQAKEMFSETLGVYDRTSLKAYFGTLPGKSKRVMTRWARYPSGTQSVKHIELSQTIEKTKGYLEKLGLVSYEQHGRVWFMVLENPVIVSQLVKANESRESIDNISLTPIPHSPLSGERYEENHSILGSRKEQENGCLIETLQTNNNLKSEREISQLPLEAYPNIFDIYEGILTNTFYKHKDNPASPTKIRRLVLKGGS